MDRISVSETFDPGSIPGRHTKNMIEIVKKLEEYKFDFEKIKLETISIVEKYNLPQIGLTHSTKNLNEEEKILESVGSIMDRKTKVKKFKDLKNFLKKLRTTIF